jgi:DNA-binding CsgD family transcriptional regulator
LLGSTSVAASPATLLQNCHKSNFDAQPRIGECRSVVTSSMHDLDQLFSRFDRTQQLNGEMTRKFTNAPGWLGLSEDRTSFVYLPDRADIVRQIFELSISGLGGYTIAKLLNSRGIPAFGTSKRWDQSTIHNMLSSRATIGEYQKKQTINGKEVPVGDPVPGYYPAVIDERLFRAAQDARRENLSSGRGRKGRLITNVFAGLCSCSYCGSPIKFHSNGQSKSLICQTVLEGGGCHRFGWSYSDFENSVFQFLSNSDVVDLKFSVQLARLHAGMQTRSERDIYNARSSILQLLKTIVAKLTICCAGVSPPATEPGDHIRRNHPDRYFTVTFADGSMQNGLPAVVPRRQTSRQFNPEDIAREFGLSPRQGSLTALLAEGETLLNTAEKLGMTLATARWHLREVFKRTNTHSQFELIKLVEKGMPGFASSKRIG